MIYIDGTNTIISIARIKQTYNHQSFDSKQLPKEDLGSDEIVIHNRHMAIQFRQAYS